MRHRFRISIAALVLLAASSICAAVATAQPLPWNPPCASATVVNMTTCNVTITLGTTPAGAIPAIALGPCASIVVPGPFPFPMTIDNVTTQAGKIVGMTTPGIVPPPFLTPCPFPISVLPADGMITGVTMPPAGCCVDLYFYSTGDPAFPCTIFVTPGTPPCIP